ncbi:conserved hypothetical protein [Nostocoides australiense Ben110]|uniref:Heparin-binding hemagglutinin n=1 Tax=Nostocoides australiense Ben110 TaxID=1193182 RepID=W6K400_9MICO|nr:hypothetical protein [Tetrasphaera australiensis]CCH74149.1 conserved hypothetical protein [Tetrasphaera australiensis Ben110]
MAKTTKKFDLRKAVTETTAPVYAYIGMTDLLIERFREATIKAGETAEKNRAEFAALPTKVQENAAELMEELQNAPAKAREMAEKAQEQYEELVTRGEKLVDRIRNQQSTKDLVAQAKHTVEMTEDAVETARRSFMDVEKSAKATFTTGRKEAAKFVGSVSDTVAQDAKEVAAEAEGAVKRTRTAAKRTTTTAKNRTTKTRTAAKTAGTNVRKTATATSKATKKAAEKVGD